jgi:hypothetical protein
MQRREKAQRKREERQAKRVAKRQAKSVKTWSSAINAASRVPLMI